MALTILEVQVLLITTDLVVFTGLCDTERVNSSNDEIRPKNCTVRYLIKALP